MIFRIFFMAVMAGLAAASTQAQELDLTLARCKQELNQKFPGARIEMTTALQYVRGSAPQNITGVKLLDTNPRGEAQFAISGDSYAEARAGFSAWVEAPVALRRILPGEKLAAEMFHNQEVNVGAGSAYEYRGVIMPRDADVAKLESRQTILEGQFLIATAIQRIPDIRRGDAIRIELNSGGLTLSTQGIAQEPAYLNNPLHVITAKSKRELVGELQPGGVVEVKL